MSTSNSNLFKWPAKISCILVRDNLLLINHYNIFITMKPEVTNQDHFITGFKKIKCFTAEYLNNSVILNENDAVPLHISKLNNNIISLPSHPSDYLFGAVLFQKFVAMSNNFFTVDEITLDSNLGDNIIYKIDADTDSILENTNRWWNQDNVDTNEHGCYPSWDELKIVNNGFEARVVKGGKSENK